MYNTYNMGLGMIIAVTKEDTAQTLEAIQRSGETAWVVGKIHAASDCKGRVDCDKDSLCLC
jgi:phosphoribosylformylglycinamidine cyclo-ligase